MLLLLLLRGPRNIGWRLVAIHLCYRNQQRFNKHFIDMVVLDDMTPNVIKLAQNFLSLSRVLLPILLRLCPLKISR